MLPFLVKEFPLIQTKDEFTVRSRLFNVIWFSLDEVQEVEPQSDKISPTAYMVVAFI